MARFANLIASLSDRRAFTPASTMRVRKIVDLRGRLPTRRR